MLDEIVAQLAPTGTLRAAINMGNFLLVTSRTETGDPAGVSPDMARAVADRLGVPVTYVPFAKPGDLADAALSGVWDIGLIGAEPERAEKISFTSAYAEIQATYLVPAGSPLTTIESVDQPGIRIVTSGRSAYGLWLTANIRHAELIRVDSIEDSLAAFVGQKLDALAGLRPRLMADVLTLPGARILDGQFANVQQAIGTPKANVAAAAFLQDFVQEAKASGLVARLIEKHGVRGLSVAGV
jgi:polar amino acid transport system substrate-binding protein